MRALPEDIPAATARPASHLPAPGAGVVRLREQNVKARQTRPAARTLNTSDRGQPTVGGAPPPAVPVAAATFGRYRIVRELGRGGMGTVYVAEDPQLRRLVALKIPQFSGSADRQAELRQRFLREARAAAALDHPNVCKVLDCGEQDGQPFVVMALVEGASLADRLEGRGRVKSRQAVSLTVRIAEGLLAVHAHGIVHRDLKPANILIKKDGTPILTDFGLARVRDASEQLTGEGAFLGTPAYMAPEQVATDLGPVTERTDLYSLGVVLFQMVTGRLPLEGSTMQIIAHHLEQKPAPPPSAFHPGIDPALDAIIRRAMAYRPDDRYADVSAFSGALKEWLRTTKDVPAAPTTLTPHEVPSTTGTIGRAATVLPSPRPTEVRWSNEEPEVRQSQPAAPPPSRHPIPQRIVRPPFTLSQGWRSL